MADCSHRCINFTAGRLRGSDRRTTKERALERARNGRDTTSTRTHPSSAVAGRGGADAPDNLKARCRPRVRRVAAGSRASTVVRGGVRLAQVVPRRSARVCIIHHTETVTKRFLFQTYVIDKTEGTRTK